MEVTQKKAVPKDRQKLKTEQSGVDTVSHEFESKLSATDYSEKYDLNDPQVFAEQAKKMSTLDEVLVLQSLMLKITESTNPREMWQKVFTWQQEAQYFKDYLRGEIKKQENGA